MRKTTLSVVAAGMLISTAFISGCSSNNSEVIAAFDGKAIDGYIANAKVYYEGYSSESRITDSNGNYSLRKRNAKMILEPIYDADGNCLTIDISTGKPYTKVLSAPAGYPVVTPLTTVLAETNVSIGTMAKVLDLNKSTINEMLLLDPVEVMNSDKYSAEKKDQAAKIFTKGVILEKQTDVLLSDKTIFDGSDTEGKLSDKGIVLETFLQNIEDDNTTTFDKVSSKKIAYIYNSAILVKNPNADVSSNESQTSATIVASIASHLNDGLDDINYTNSGYNLAVSIGKNSDELVQITQKLLENNSTSVDDNVTNILEAVNFKSNAIILNAEVATLIENGADENITQEKSVQSQSAIKLFDNKVQANDFITINPAPTIVGLKTHIDLNTSVQSFNLNIVLSDKDDAGNDVSSNASYIARVENNDIISLSGEKLVLTANDSYLPVTINNAGNAKLYITPIDAEGKVGIEKVVTFSIAKEIDKTPLNLTLSQYSYDFTSTLGVPDETKVDLAVDIEDTDNDGAYKNLILTSSDEDVVKVNYNEESKILSLYPVYNGSATINITAVDTNNLSTSKDINITVSGVSLPPVLVFNDSSVSIVKNPSESATITLPYSILDPDNDSSSLYSVHSSNDNIVCEDDNNDKNITCTIDESVAKGEYKVFAKPVDSLGLKGEEKSLTLNLFEGNVAPELNLISGTKVTMDAMTTKQIAYIATDLNKDDNLTVSASSSDTSIVDVSIDSENNNLVVVAQPKVGTAIVTVAVTDGELKGNEKTIEFTTVNELDTLISSLKVVPLIDNQNAIFDNRYTMHNFDAVYDIESNSVVVNGDINDTYYFSDFRLNADTNLSQFGGSDDDKTYGLVIDTDVRQEGQNFHARALGFSTSNDSVPYTWALATDKEICNYDFNESVITLINDSNLEPVSCGE